MGHTWHWIAVVVYSLLMIGLGVATRMRRARPGEESASLGFWIAHRKLPGWWLGMSLTAGWLMLGWISYGMAQVYQYGATGLWILPIPWFILCFLIVAAVPFVRRVGAVSLPEALHRRFGLSARAVVAGLSFLVFILWTQAELFIGASIIAPFLGVGESSWIAVLVLIVPSAVYLYLGGFRAVVLTDVVQFVVMAAFMVILAVSALGAASEAAPGGILAALSEASPPASGAGETLSLGFLGFVFPLILLLGFLPGWLVEQDLTLRLQAARDTREARKAAWLGLGCITTFVLVLPSIAAFCALVVFPPEGGAPAAAVGADATGIVTAFIARMGPALAVFMVVGVTACQMSTVDTFTNVSAMPIAYDLIVPVFLRGRVSDRVRVVIARTVTLLTLGLAALLAMVSGSLGDVYNISSGVLSACIAVPALFLFWKRTTLPAVLAAAAAGFVGTVGMYGLENKGWSESFALPGFLEASAGYNYVATGVVLSVVTIILVSLVTRKPSAAALEAVSAAPVDDWREFTKGLPDRRE
jgi:SSS family solute:Na+ symporter